MEALVKHAQSKEELRAAYALRFHVFVEEQDVPPELEQDDLDATAFHAVVLQNGQVVGTGRLIPGVSSGDITTGVIGRMAVNRRLRRQGVGASLLDFLEQEARLQGVQRITLHAQTFVKDFYARHGYGEEGQPFLEVGIQHVQMSKDLG